MIPRHVDEAIAAALALLPAQMGSVKAKAMLYAIGLQESNFEHRVQLPLHPGGRPGPARSWFQMERGGGVTGVLEHSASELHAKAICRLRDVAPVPHDVWSAMAHDDVLGAAFARLLLFTDPRPLPALADREGAWLYYLRNWRPGKPHRSKWNSCHPAAVLHVDRRREHRDAR
jgi:hypothetical protein